MAIHVRKLGRKVPKYSHPNPNLLKGRVIRSKFKRITVGTTFTETYEQGYRVEDTSLELYELFAGVNVPVDYSAPVATSATLPFSWAPTLPGGGNATVKVVVRKKDNYGLESFNVYETIIKFVNSVAVNPPITPPTSVVVNDAATGALRVSAKYLSTFDPVAPADTWEVYVKIGSDPVPGTDTPVYTASMLFSDVFAWLDQTVSSWTPGTVAHVIVTAKRTSDGARGNSTVVLHTLASLPALPQGNMFGGNAYEQK